MRINSFDEFIDFIEKSDLTQKQIDSLVGQSLFVWYVKEYHSKSEMINVLKDFWAEWGNVKEKPLFID